MSNKEFYIGYQSKAPSGIAALVRKATIAILLVVAIVAVVLVVGQNSFPVAIFEFGNEKTFTGKIVIDPYPALLVLRDGQPGALPAWSRYSLVEFGKYGADETMANFAGKWVELNGTLIYRDGQTMIEIVTGSVSEKTPANDQGASELRSMALGEFTLTGEIVDSKCFLGVMNPGNLKPHQSCAIRCVSGGIPPVLVVKDEEGFATYFTLTSKDGMAVNESVLPFIAEPVSIAGNVDRVGDRYFFRIDPGEIVRL